MDLCWSHLDAAAVPAWADLTNLLAEADGTEEFYDAADLAEELEESGFSPATDSWAVWDGDRMVAYGQLRVGHTRDAEGRVRATLGGGVAPHHRGRGIGRELADRMERRALELAAERHPGAQSYWRADGGLEGSSARALWSHRGYEVVRYFNLLTRPLPGPSLDVPEVAATLASPGPTRRRTSDTRTTSRSQTTGAPRHRHRRRGRTTGLPAPTAWTCPPSPSVATAPSSRTSSPASGWSASCT